MPHIVYPYMPPDRHLAYVPVDHPFMREAARAREELAGDPSYPVGIVMVKEDRVVARAGNGFNRGRQVHVCPRIVLECPTGVGYELCGLHDPPGHAEPQVINAAREQGIDPQGSDLYLFGHWWCCEPCWKAMIEAGVRDVYVVDDAHERFSRDAVYGETLAPSVKSAYIAGGPITNAQDFEAQKRFYEALGAAAEELGCRSCIPHRDNGENQKPHGEKSAAAVYAWATGAVGECDVVVAEVSVPSLGTGGELVEAARIGRPVVLLSKKGSRVSAFARGNPAVVYHIEYDDEAQAARQLKNVLRQL